MGRERNDKMFLCPLCGYESSTDARPCAEECPLKEMCQFMVCARCGYRVIETALAAANRFAERIWNRYEGCLAGAATAAYALN